MASYSMTYVPVPPQMQPRGGDIVFLVLPDPPVSQPRSTGEAKGIRVRMRGYDTTLARTVYWTADAIDPAASQYPGPGPVINIVEVDELIG